MIATVPMEIGHVEAIFPYPVKSMGGERLEVAELAHNGLGWCFSCAADWSSPGFWAWELSTVSRIGDAAERVPAGMQFKQ